MLQARVCEVSTGHSEDFRCRIVIGPDVPLPRPPRAFLRVERFFAHLHLRQCGDDAFFSSVSSRRC